MGKNRSKIEIQQVVRLHKYFENEKENIEKSISEGKLKKECIPIQFSNVIKRTAEALGCSCKTIKRVLQEHRKETSEHQTSKRKRGRKEIVVDCFTEGVIRRGILEAYKKNEVITTKVLHTRLQTDENFPRMSCCTLRKIMKKQLKFKFLKFQSKKSVF